MKRWIVTCVDYNDSCDGKARVLGSFKTKDEAVNYITEDIKEWCDERAGLDIVCDFDDMSVSYGDDRCEWNFEEIEID